MVCAEFNPFILHQPNALPVANSEVRSTVSQIRSLTCKVFFLIFSSELLNPSDSEEKRLPGVYQSLEDALLAPDVKLEEVFNEKPKTGKLHKAHQGAAWVVRSALVWGTMLTFAPLGVVVNSLSTTWYVCRAIKHWVHFKYDPANVTQKELLEDAKVKVGQFARAYFADLFYTLAGLTIAAYDLVFVAAMYVPVVGPVFDGLIAKYHSFWIANGGGDVASAVYKTIELKKKFGVVDARGKALSLCEENDEAMKVNRDLITKTASVNFTGPLATKVYQNQETNLRKEMARLCSEYPFLAGVQVDNPNEKLEKGLEIIRSELVNKFEVNHLSKAKIEEILVPFDKHCKALLNISQMILDCFAVREYCFMDDEKDKITPFFYITPNLAKPLFVTEYRNSLDSFTIQSEAFREKYASIPCFPHPQIKLAYVTFREGVLSGKKAHELFNLAADATKEDVTREYRHLLKNINADHLSSDLPFYTEATELMQVLIAANDLLMKTAK